MIIFLIFLLNLTKQAQNTTSFIETETHKAETVNIGAIVDDESVIPLIINFPNFSNQLEIAKKLLEQIANNIDKYKEIITKSTIKYHLFILVVKVLGYDVSFKGNDVFYLSKKASKHINTPLLLKAANTFYLNVLHWQRIQRALTKNIKYKEFFWFLLTECKLFFNIEVLFNEDCNELSEELRIILDIDYLGWLLFTKDIPSEANFSYKDKHIAVYYNEKTKNVFNLPVYTLELLKNNFNKPITSISKTIKELIIDDDIFILIPTDLFLESEIEILQLFVFPNSKEPFYQHLLLFLERCIYKLKSINLHLKNPYDYELIYKIIGLLKEKDINKSLELDINLNCTNLENLISSINNSNCLYLVFNAPIENISFVFDTKLKNLFLQFDHHLPPEIEFTPFDLYELELVSQNLTPNISEALRKSKITILKISCAEFIFDDNFFKDSLVIKSVKEVSFTNCIIDYSLVHFLSKFSICVKFVGCLFRGELCYLRSECVFYFYYSYDIDYILENYKDHNNIANLN